MSPSFAQTCNSILPNFLSEFLRIPLGTSSQMLNSVGILIAHLFSNLQTIFPLDGTEQGLNVIASSLAGFSSSKVSTQALLKRFQYIALLANRF